MKRESGERTVTVEDFYRRCLQAKKPRLGQVASKRGSRGRRRRIYGRKQATLWDRLRASIKQIMQSFEKGRIGPRGEGRPPR